MSQEGGGGDKSGGGRTSREGRSSEDASGRSVVQQASGCCSIVSCTPEPPRLQARAGQGYTHAPQKQGCRPHLHRRLVGDQAGAGAEEIQKVLRRAVAADLQAESSGGANGCWWAGGQSPQGGPGSVSKLRRGLALRRVLLALELEAQAVVLC